MAHVEYKQMYRQAQELGISEALELIRGAETDEERSFYTCLLNWNFQRKQKRAIEQNLF